MDWMYYEKAERVLKVVEKQLVPDPSYDMLRWVLAIGCVGGAFLSLCNMEPMMYSSGVVCFAMLVLAIIFVMCRVRKEQLFDVELRFYFDRLVVIRTDAKGGEAELRKEIRSYVYVDEPKVTYVRRKKRLVLEGCTQGETYLLKRTTRKTDPVSGGIVGHKCTLDLRIPDKTDIVKEIEVNSPLKVIVV